MIVKPLYTGENSTHQVRRYIGNGEFSDYEKKDSPFASPWGRAQEVTLIQRGFREVTAPKGSGFMLSNKLIEKSFSPGASVVGVQYGGYYCFSEDSGFSTVVYYEVPEIALAILGREVTSAEVQKDLGDELFAEYSLANGKTTNEVAETTTTSAQTQAG